MLGRPELLAESPSEEHLAGAGWSAAATGHRAAVGAPVCLPDGQLGRGVAAGGGPIKTITSTPASLRLATNASG